jgi:pimeloyl-ACP methyl ester carboxylesterase
MRTLLSVVAVAVWLAVMTRPTAANPEMNLIDVDCPGLPTPLPVQEVRGTVGPGAAYLLYAPPAWEDLVVYAHGYVSTTAPVGFSEPSLLAQIVTVRDALVCPVPGLKPSYAVAISSYSENGFAVKRGAQQTHQVGKLFVETFGEPRRTYLAGASLGGGIVTFLAERYGSQYDGTLAMCGFVGGSQLQIDYIADLRNAFDYFYPGVIPGDALHVPPDLDFDHQVEPAVTAAILAEAAVDPDATITKALALASMEQIQLPLRGLDLLDPTELIASMGESLLNALYYDIDGTNAILDKTQGRSPYDNIDTVYSSIEVPLLPAPVLEPLLVVFNAEVNRFASSPNAEKYLDHWFTPNGKLKHPMVTLHTTLDPAVPYFHEAAYDQVVAQAGASDRLVQLPVSRYGHCNFEDHEVLDAFMGLVWWVETGMNPWAP